MNRLGLITIILAALTVVPAASAKGHLAITIDNRTPRVNQSFTVVVRTGWIVPADDWLRLIAVAPGRPWFDVVGTVTGDSTTARASVPRDGFEIKLKRTGAKQWRARVRLTRPGQWRLVVPNGTHVGFMVPPPAAWMPWVTVRR